MDGNLSPGDFEGNILPTAADGNCDLGSRGTLHPPDHAVLGEFDAGDYLVVHLQNPVSLLQPDLLRGASRDDFQHDGSVVRHVELDTDPIEIAGEFGLGFFQFDRRHVHRMGIQFRQGSRDGRVGDCFVVDGVDVVLFDLVQD